MRKQVDAVERCLAVDDPVEDRPLLLARPVAQHLQRLEPGVPVLVGLLFLGGSRANELERLTRGRDFEYIGADRAQDTARAWPG